MPVATLEVRGLSKFFAGVRALTKVSFTAGAGEILGIVGPNGAGKTTLFNCITGLLPASEGSVRWQGREILGLRPYQIERAGVTRTFQINRFLRRLTVEMNLRIALEQRPDRIDPAAEIPRLLARVGLEVPPDSVAGDLPFGYQRLLTVACALALRPRLLLLDEPGAGLQQAEKVRLAGLIRRLAADQVLGVVIVDHDMKMILELCHRLLVLNHGETIAEGPPAAVAAHPDVVEAYLGRGLSFSPSAG